MSSTHPKPSRPRTHAAGCLCPYCAGRKRARASLEHQKQLVLADAAKHRELEAARAAGATPQQAAKRVAWRESLDAQAKDTAARAAALEAARAVKEPKTVRMLELKAQGKTLAEAFEIIEAEEAQRKEATNAQDE